MTTPTRPAAMTTPTRPAALGPLTRPAALGPRTRPAALAPLARLAALARLAPLARLAALAPLTRLAAMAPLARPATMTTLTRRATMTTLTRRATMTTLTRLLAALAVLAFATGCPGPSGAPTNVDEQRLAVAKSEPLVALDKQPTARAGFQTSKNVPPKRGSVVAGLADESAPSPDTAARGRTKEFVERLRSDGWTVYLAACVPPRPAGSPAPDPDAIPAVQFEDGWTFVAYAYKLTDGVSYFASLEGHGASNKQVRVSLLLRVPQSAEPTPDLFPDRPPALAPATSCIEATTPLPTQRTVTGPTIEVDSDGPDPDGSQKPAGHR